MSQAVHSGMMRQGVYSIDPLDAGLIRAYIRRCERLTCALFTGWSEGNLSKLEWTMLITEITIAFTKMTTIVTFANMEVNPVSVD